MLLALFGHQRFEAAVSVAWLSGILAQLQLVEDPSHLVLPKDLGAEPDGDTVGRVGSRSGLGGDGFWAFLVGKDSFEALFWVSQKRKLQDLF